MIILFFVLDELGGCGILLLEFNIVCVYVVLRFCNVGVEGFGLDGFFYIEMMIDMI